MSESSEGLKGAENEARHSEWRKARFPGSAYGSRFLCRVDTANGKAFWGIVVAEENSVGKGKVYIPVSTQARLLERDRIPGLSWMSEQNREQFDPAPVANDPGGALRQVGADPKRLPYTMSGYTSSTNIRGIDLALELDREIMRLRKGTSESSALDLATQFDKALRWKIKPIESAKFLGQQMPQSLP